MLAKVASQKLFSWAAIAAIALATNSPCFAEQVTPSRDVQPNIQGPLKLADTDFWGNFKKTKPDVLAWISSHNFRGLLIDAPQHVITSAHADIPVVGYFARSLRDDLVINQEQSMLVVAVDLDSFLVRVGPAFQRDKAPVPTANSNRAAPADGMTVNAFEFDLRLALELPYTSARFHVTTLLRDFVSNGAIINVTHSSSTEAPIAPIVFDTTPDRRGLPDYHRRTHSPALPKQDGIDFKIVNTRNGPEMRGSYRVTVPRNLIIGNPSSRVRLTSPKHAKPTAIVPISFVVTGHEIAGPWVLTVNAPSYEPIDNPSEQLQANGYFTLGPKQLANFPQQAATYYVTAFAGPVQAGPYKWVVGKK